MVCSIVLKGTYRAQGVSCINSMIKAESLEICMLIVHIDNDCLNKKVVTITFLERYD